MSDLLNQVPAEHRSAVASLPKGLQKLVVAELAAGNVIAESGAGFPAPPCGTLIRMSQPLSTVGKRLPSGVRACSYPNWTLKSGYTDAEGHFFVMNPPEPPPPEPDMDLIRASLQPAEPPPGSRRQTTKRPSPTSRKSRAKSATTPGLTVPEPRLAVLPDAVAPLPPTAPAVPKTAYDRFVASMHIDYEKWREGIGYDLEAIRDASDEERRQIEELLVGRGGCTWRDVTALAALGTRRAMHVLRHALVHGSHEVQMAVMNAAPDLVDHDVRTRSLVDALANADLYAGLSQALDQVEEFHPPEVIDALLRSALERDGGIAPSFAARLFFIHGLSDIPFDWNHRPFFLRFNTADRAEREAAFRELCQRIGVEPTPYLRPRSARRKP